MRLDIKKTEPIEIEGLEAVDTLIHNMTKEFISKMQKKEEELFTEILRTLAEPPIKGEITKGKIQWRGIRLIRQIDGFDSYSWLEQRGVRISPKFKIEGRLVNF